MRNTWGKQPWHVSDTASKWDEYERAVRDYMAGRRPTEPSRYFAGLTYADTASIWEKVEREAVTQARPADENEYDY